MNIHHRVQKNLPLYVSGDLPPEAVSQVEQHLRNCAECQATAQRQRELFGVLIAESEVAIPPVRVRRPRWLLSAAALLLTFTAGFVVAKKWPTASHRTPSSATPTRFYQAYVGAPEDRSELFRALSALAPPQESR